MDRLSFELPDFEPGWVWLAGAGPGDPGLLTLHALHGLRTADVVVYDALVSAETLAWRSPPLRWNMPASAAAGHRRPRRISASV